MPLLVNICFTTGEDGIDNKDVPDPSIPSRPQALRSVPSVRSGRSRSELAPAGPERTPLRLERDRACPTRDHPIRDVV
jgi:hypothetical protein